MARVMLLRGSLSMEPEEKVSHRRWAGDSGTGAASQIPTSDGKQVWRGQVGLRPSMSEAPGLGDSPA